MRRIAVTIALTASAVLVAGCSNPLDSIAEDGIEQGIERLAEEAVEGEGELDINLDGEQVVGTITYSPSSGQ